jgi:L-histidine N-alpha-methyltransferase
MARIAVRLDEARRRRALADDVRRGLTRRPKSLPPKYFYDETGSALFAKITELPEYYLTRAERRLLRAHARELMVESRPAEIVELGAGAADKAHVLLGAAAGVRRYVAVDVDDDGLSRTVAELETAHPDVDVRGVVGDFEHDLAAVEPPVGRRLVAFLGSTIGNLDPEPRRRFLHAVRRLLAPGDGFLLGVDLVKDVTTLEAAYNDAAGVTAAFNRNILRVIGRALDGDVDPEAFEHRAWFDRDASRIEMHLVASTPQTLKLRRIGLAVTVAAGESIWTESSYKFTRATVAAMLADAGLDLQRWLAPDGVALALARAA